MTRRSKAELFQIMSASGSGNLVVQLGARYAKPYDDTTILSVSHRTTGGAVSVLLERGEFHALAVWLAEPAPGPGRSEEDFLPEIPRPVEYHRSIRHTAVQFEVHDLQTTATITKYNGTTDLALAVSIAWNGSGRQRGAVLDHAAAKQLLDFVTDADTHGWTGWRSGRTEGERKATV